MMADGATNRWTLRLPVHTNPHPAPKFWEVLLEREADMPLLLIRRPDAPQTTLTSEGA